jgi:hypothetical protein
VQHVAEFISLLHVAQYSTQINFTHLKYDYIFALH